MEPCQLLLLLCAGILGTLHPAAGDDGLCFTKVNSVTGECEDYLGEGVSENDCCLNIKYGFKRDASSPCEACQPSEWGQWSEWDACTVSCLEGVQKRQRVCIGQGDCDGDKMEVRACSLQDCCPKVGGWSSWSGWSSCSVTCAIGRRRRTRECNNPPPSCGASCPGHAEEIEQCDTQQICPTHGQWSGWGNWGPCSTSCTVEGSGIFPTQLRTRVCNNPPPSSNPPGNPCAGNDRESRDCTSVPLCPVHGQWGAWQKDSECSVTCGVGQVRERRTCNNPAPRLGGNPCPGSPERDVICNTKLPCPVDGKWAEWDEWSECKRLSSENINCLKKKALQHRKRKCIGTEHNGNWCVGDARESRSCYNIDDCQYTKPGRWTEWSQWGLCSSYCGESIRKRYRECEPVHYDWPTMDEGPINIIEIFFWGNPRYSCPKVDGKVVADCFA
ncbi:properdin [Gastrophryne carolinensis]